MVRRLGYILLILACSVQLSGAQENSDNLIYGIPSSPDLLLNRRGFAIGYSHLYRQPLWVCYILTDNQLNIPKIRRSNKFRPDPDIAVNPVKPAEYRRSGYDRGHLAPAADMSYAELPMRQSFYMSNISPQIPGFNRGIWKRLELQIRKWAQLERKLYIITGPLFLNPQNIRKMKSIPVPDAFFKLILDLTPPRKMAAFIIPNHTTKKRLKGFSVTVDMVEALTGFDFFSGLPDEARMESRNQIDFWLIGK